MYPPKDKPYTIYAIQCTVTKRVYIGASTAFDGRVEQHFRELMRGGKDRRISKNERGPSQWQLDYNEHGHDAFKVYVIEANVPNEKGHEREQHYMDMYHATDPDYGYNVNPSIKKKLFSYTVGLPELPQHATNESA